MDWLQDDDTYRTYADVVVDHFSAMKGMSHDVMDFDLGGQEFKYVGLRYETMAKERVGSLYSFQCRVEGCENWDTTLLLDQITSPGKGLHLTCADHADVEPPKGAWLRGHEIAEAKEAEFGAWQRRQYALGKPFMRRGKGPIGALMRVIEGENAPPGVRVGVVEQAVLTTLSDLALLGTTPTAEMVVSGTKPRINKPKGKDVRRRMARDALKSLERKGLAQVVW